MGKVVLTISSKCNGQQQDKLLGEIVGIKGFANVDVKFPQFTVTGNFKPEDLGKVAKKYGISSVKALEKETEKKKVTTSSKSKEKKTTKKKATTSTPNRTAMILNQVNVYHVHFSLKLGL